MKAIKNEQDLEQSPWGKMAQDPKTWESVCTQAEHWLGRVGKDKPIAQNAQRALKMLRNEANRKELVTVRNGVILAAALLYTISPLDCIPDALPVIGWLDDLGVLALAFKAITSGLVPASRGGENNSGTPGAEQGEDQETPGEALVEEWGARRHSSGSAPEGQDALIAEIETLKERIRALDNETLTALGDEAMEQAADPLLRLVFTGTFNSGKSSLINLLLGRELLPTGPVPTTPALTTIVYGEEPRAVAEWKDGTVETPPVEKLATLHGNKDNPLDEIAIFLPHGLLKDGLTLVDTAGLQDDTHNVLDYGQLPRASAILFVKSATIGSLDQDEHRFLQGLAEQASAKQLIVVITHADQESGESINKLRQEIQNALEGWGLKGVPLYAVCSAPDAKERYEWETLKHDLEHRAQGNLRRLSQANLRKSLDSLEHYCRAAEEQQREEQRLDAQKRQEW